MLQAGMDSVFSQFAPSVRCIIIGVVFWTVAGIVIAIRGLQNAASTPNGRDVQRRH